MNFNSAVISSPSSTPRLHHHCVSHDNPLASPPPPSTRPDCPAVPSDVYEIPGSDAAVSCCSSMHPFSSVASLDYRYHTNQLDFDDPFVKEPTSSSSLIWCRKSSNYIFPTVEENTKLYCQVAKKSNDSAESGDSDDGSVYDYGISTGGLGCSNRSEQDQQPHQLMMQASYHSSWHKQYHYHHHHHHYPPSVMFHPDQTTCLSKHDEYCFSA